MQIAACRQWHQAVNDMYGNLMVSTAARVPVQQAVPGTAAVLLLYYCVPVWTYCTWYNFVPRTTNSVNSNFSLVLRVRTLYTLVLSPVTAAPQQLHLIEAGFACEAQTSLSIGEQPVHRLALTTVNTCTEEDSPLSTQDGPTQTAAAVQHSSYSFEQQHRVTSPHSLERADDTKTPIHAPRLHRA